MVYIDGDGYYALSPLRDVNEYARLDGATFTSAVSGVTPTGDTNLTRKDYVDDADDLKADVAGATFTGETSGITPVNDANFVIKSYVDGLVTMPTHTSDQYVATKAISNFVAGNATGANGVAFADGSHTATIPDTLAGNVYVGLFRLSSDPAPVFLDIGASGFNQIGGVTQQAGTVTINAQTYDVWVTNNSGDYGGEPIEFR